MYLRMGWFLSNCASLIECNSWFKWNEAILLMSFSAVFSTLSRGVSFPLKKNPTMNSFTLNERVQVMRLCGGLLITLWKVFISFRLMHKISRYSHESESDWTSLAPVVFPNSSSVITCMIDTGFRHKSAVILTKMNYPAVQCCWKRF